MENNKIFDRFSKNISPASPAPARETDCGEMNLGQVINSLQKKTNQTKFWRNLQTNAWRFINSLFPIIFNNIFLSRAVRQVNKSKAGPITTMAGTD